jgi:acyl-coenzyme A synthetase/AMP-(fatty) acid ligase
MYFNFFLDRFRENPDATGIIWRDEAYTYQWMLDRVEFWTHYLDEQGIEAGDVVSIVADYSPGSISLFFALANRNCILVPLTYNTHEDKRREFLDVALVNALIYVKDDDAIEMERRDVGQKHEIIEELRTRDVPGLIVFTSGSTGKHKAVVHDMVPLLEKFKKRRHTLRTVTFLLFDHMGGVNTMLYVLSNTGTIIAIESRNPDDVLKAVERHRVELLPTSPTFINLMLMSDAVSHYDLSSLKKLTYGTEPMPLSTLKRFNEAFPEIQLQQTYGLSELGVMRSQSQSNESLWVKIGGEGFETRVVDGKLEIKAKSSMLGYLNAPSPLTEDGWFVTGDKVEVDGEYFRILGRESELINVGGDKVYPQEVESTILDLDNVADVTAYGKDHPFTGRVVAARVVLREEEETSAFVLRLKKYCMEKLKPYQVPVHVEVVERDLFNVRYKKTRSDVDEI